MRSRLITILVPLLVLAMSAVGTAVAAPGGGERVNVIVVLQDGADARSAAADAAREHRAEVSFVYEHALQGFAASVPEGRLHALQRDPRVDSVEADRVATIQAQETPTGVERVLALDNTTLPFDGSDQRVDVDVAIVDTGIDLQHPDLHVVSGVDCTGGGPFGGGCAPGGDDDHYHGTHVAGTVGALDNDLGVIGVAPGARLHAVKVLNHRGSGYTSWIVAGIDWVVAKGDIEVLNMSLGGSGACSNGSAYDNAIDGAVAAGVAVVVAAGNSAGDAADYSPASCANAFTVSALADFNGLPGGGANHTCRKDVDDTFADFSNYGGPVDVIAPGVCILSTFPLEEGEYASISGTSMAAPHVAGAMALLASGDSPPSVESLYNTVRSNGTDDWFTDTDPDSTHELLLDVSGFTATMVDGGETSPSNAAPTASFTYSCTDLACSFDGSDSSDPDNDGLTHTWEFGDSSGATGTTTNHTYGSGGTYDVTLTVDDGKGGSDSQTQQVSVTAPNPTTGIQLTTSPWKEKGRHRVNLTWTGTNLDGSVDIYVNGGLLTQTDDTGSYTFANDERGGATYTFMICESGTTACSNESTAVF